jgi:hypothetical protein
MPQGAASVGPQGRWFVALVIAGWLLVLFAAQSTSQVVGGLWLAAGLPWVRRDVRRRLVLAAERAAGGLRHATVPASIVVVEHAGLARLAAILAAAAPHGPAAAYQAAARDCAAAGLPWLAPAYAALATGETPPLLWAPLPAPAVVTAADTLHPGDAPVPEQAVLEQAESDSTMPAQPAPAQPVPESAVGAAQAPASQDQPAAPVPTPSTTPTIASAS